jgi:hypothetical protein
VATFSGEVKAPALLVFDSPSQWSARLAKLAGKRVRVEIKQAFPKRSLAANDYLWVLYTDLADWSGYEPDDFHEYFKEHRLPKREGTLPSGVKIEMRGSTTDCDSKEMLEYTDYIRNWAALNGHYLPSPDEWRQMGGHK